MVRVLSLVLKRIWYDMILHHGKVEEYREITPYWVNRLLKEVDFDGNEKRIKLEQGVIINLDNLKTLIASHHLEFRYQRGDFVEFALGYSKDRPTMIKTIKAITIGKGKKEWGANPNKDYFIIHFS